MKRALLILMGSVAATAMYGQGSFNFDNVNVSVVTIAVSPAFVSPGNNGDYVGSDYTASFIWGYGTLGNPSLLVNTWTGTPVQFYGSTGTDPNNGPTEDGAGYFDTGSAVTLDNSGGNVVTIEALVWYNPTGTYTFAYDVAHGLNTGVSSLITLTLATGTAFVPELNPASFTVQSAPEPSTLVLAGLGSAALLLFRRRQS